MNQISKWYLTFQETNKNHDLQSLKKKRVNYPRKCKHAKANPIQY